MGSSMGLQLVGGECGEGVYTNDPRARAFYQSTHKKEGQRVQVKTSKLQTSGLQSNDSGLR